MELFCVGHVGKRVLFIVQSAQSGSNGHCSNNLAALTDECILQYYIYAGYIMLYAYVWSRPLEPGVLPRSLLFLLIDRRFRRLLGRAPSRMEVDGHFGRRAAVHHAGPPRREIFFPKQVYLWGRVKSMDANVQIRSEMCV